MSPGGRFLLTHARIVAHGNSLQDAEILVEGERIAGVGKPGELHVPTDAIVVDVRKHLVLPGLIDPHVHLRDSGVPHAEERQKEDFVSGTKAAVAGGVTTVLDMPNTLPPTTSLAAFKTKRDHAAKTSFCDFGLYAGAAQDNLAAVPAMIRAGAVACKMYVGSSTGNLLVAESTLEETFFKSAAENDYVLAIHAEDQACLEKHAAFYDDKKAPRHNEVRPPECAELAVARAISFARTYRTKTYVCHSSTAAEAGLIRAAKAEGLPVFMEVAPHHLFFDQSEHDVQHNRVRMNPPLRSRADVKALWTALNDGTADTIGTDHAPHTLEQKRKPYWEAPSGVPGLETVLPLLVTAALGEKTTLERVQQLCCQNPARIFGLQGKGRLEAGCDADLVFVDLDVEKAVGESTLFTRCGWSPYAGMRLRGWPLKTYLRGRLVFDRGQPFGHFGKMVSPLQTNTA
ncbi:dihydroorotase family protein [Candidatus Micrarchaeota archaeon]|nr:dihydroorotase family protein [Candidatus Micrarchaeota archaeon]